MSAFLKYLSIENARSGLVTKYAPSDDETWVALEKIHGANLGFSYTDGDDDVLLQRHKDFIGADESFYGVHKSPTIKALKEKVKQLFKIIAATRPLQRLLVYGELFGGNIQKQIKYSEEIQFVCFDVVVDWTFLACEDLPALCAQVDIPFVQELRRGSARSLFDHYSQHDVIERLPSFYTTQYIAEGVILRPLKDEHLLGQREPRRILKMKRQEFRERNKSSATTDDTKKKNSDVFDLALEFITLGRLTTLLPKLGEDRTLVIVAKALAADALEDIAKAHFWSQVPPTLHEKIAKAVSNAAFRFVKNNGF